jgi:hypothetical protein
MSAIPNQCHFVFGLRKQTAPFHLVHYLCLNSCLEVNRPDAIYFYCQFEPYGRYWDLIRPKLTLVKAEPVAFLSRFQYKDRYVSKYSYAHQADFIRLEKLVERGGVYADMDTIFVNPIPPRLFAEPFVLGREGDIVDQETGQVRRSLCNAFIMAAPEAEFGRLWLRAMEGAFDGSWSRHSTLLPQELSDLHPELIHIEPSQSFYKHMWTREGISTLLEGLDADSTGVVSMHLWSHLWWSRWRSDFSRFHAGKLTEEYIRRVDTTYNLVARRFLPKPR